MSLDTRELGVQSVHDASCKVRRRSSQVVMRQLVREITFTKKQQVQIARVCASASICENMQRMLRRAALTLFRKGFNKKS